MPTPRTSAEDYLPHALTYPDLCKAATICRGCDLYKHATQTVFGEGSLNAHLILVGEQPGNDEDLAGHPFVGPAGKILAKALRAAGIPDERIYTTNAVKHFKFMQEGKRRLHKKPSAREVTACKPWLEAEIALIKPKAVICLGSTAAQALLGSRFSLLKNLGRWQEAADLKIMATYHPSAALRAPDHAMRVKIFNMIVDALKSVAEE